MDPIILALLIGSVGGPLGGLAAAGAGLTFLRSASNGFRGALLAFAGGVILTVAFLELMRRGLEQGKDWVTFALVIGGLVTGAGIRGLLTRLAGSLGDDQSEGDDQSKDDNQSDEQSGDKGYAQGQARGIAISLAAVNLLEGVPVGIGFVAGNSLGFIIGAIMIFENFTEGLTISTELSESDASTGRVLFMTTVPTVTLGLGAVAGVFLGGLSPLVMAALLGAAAGIMLYVVADDIVYDAHQLGPGAITTLPLLLGVVVAAVLVRVG